MRIQKTRDTVFECPKKELLKKCKKGQWIETVGTVKEQETVKDRLHCIYELFYM